jgi:hypothetical protein
VLPTSATFNGSAVTVTTIANTATVTVTGNGTLEYSGGGTLTIARGGVAGQTVVRLR